MSERIGTMINRALAKFRLFKIELRWIDALKGQPKLAQGNALGKK
jgi:hypothetical protein